MWESGIGEGEERAMGDLLLQPPVPSILLLPPEPLLPGQAVFRVEMNATVE